MGLSHATMQWFWFKHKVLDKILLQINNIFWRAWIQWKSIFLSQDLNEITQCQMRDGCIIKNCEGGREEHSISYLRRSPRNNLWGGFRNLGLDMNLSPYRKQGVVYTIRHNYTLKLTDITSWANHLNILTPV
jgi:hypothetical protein